MNTNSEHVASEASRCRRANVFAAANHVAAPRLACSDIEPVLDRSEDDEGVHHRQSEIDQIILQENVIVDKVSHANEPPTEALNAHSYYKVVVVDDGQEEPFHLAEPKYRQPSRQPASLGEQKSQAYLNTTGSPARE